MLGWINSIKAHFLGQPGSPQFGFFGDHWQKIYGDGCGKIEPALTVIGKEANFRSVKTIVDCLNRMRPELPQFVVDPDEAGSVRRIFHTNGWSGTRQTGHTGAATADRGIPRGPSHQSWIVLLSRVGIWLPRRRPKF